MFISQMALGLPAASVIVTHVAVTVKIQIPPVFKAVVLAKAAEIATEVTSPAAAKLRAIRVAMRMNFILSLKINLSSPFKLEERVDPILKFDPF